MVYKQGVHKKKSSGRIQNNYTWWGNRNKRSPQNSDPCILYAIMIAMTRKMSLFCANYNPIKFIFCNIDEVHYKWTGDCVPLN